ncbi:MAG: peptidyl-prolyl cis-trans isomerase [Candidatus Methylomirabilia bacterium]
MRGNAVFVLVIIILIVGVFIGTIFLVWGRGSTSSSQSERSVAAWVGKEEVPYAEYIRAHDSRMEFYRRFYPGVTANELEKRFRVKKGALDSAIGRRLLLDEARRMGLVVGDEEIASKVRETAAFQENGAFDPKKYREVLAASGLKTVVYEDDVRGELLAGKVKALVQEPVRIAETEAFDEFRREKEKIRLTLVMLPAPAPVPGATVPLEEARRVFDGDPAKYTRPERARFAYAAVLAREAQPAAPASEEELRSYYEQNTAEFRTERAVHARHILFRLAEGAEPGEEKKVRERAQFVLGKARAGTDFAALAREFSQDSSGPAGGELGWFSAGQMVPAFEQAAFALSAGQVSDLVRTQFGLHIIKVEETREAGTPSFEQARAEVVRKHAAAAARTVVASRAEQFNDALATGEFEAAAAKFGLTVKTTDLVPREGPIPGLAARPELVESLFALAEGEVSELLRQGDDYWVYKVLAKRPAAVPSFEEARADVERELLAEKARDRAIGEGRLRLADLRRGDSPQSIAARARGEVRETAFFTQRDFVAEAGVKGELFQGAFSLGIGLSGGPVAAPDGRVILYRVDGKLPVTRESFLADKDAVIARLLSAKRDQYFESWLEDLRRVRAVKINDALVGKF